MSNPPELPGGPVPPTPVPSDSKLRAAPVARTPAPPPPGLIDHPRYKLIGVVETGGMGTVYKAEHQIMKRLVALKIVNPSLLSSPQMRDRFFKEIGAAARLTHPNIVQAYDAERLGESHFLVMEFVEGTNLHELVRRNGRLPVGRACDYVRQAAAALQYAFEQGILHRDVKPHNLMLTPGGVVKILDFGLARHASELAAEELEFELGTPLQGPDVTLGGGGPPPEPPELPPMKTRPVSQRMTYRGLGTPDFIAPEMALDPRRADVRTDIYSLGCTLYFFLAGQVPFPGGDLAYKLRCHWHRTPTLLRDLRGDVPPRLEEVLARMMAKNPSERFQTPGEVASALGSFAASHSGRLLVVDDDPFTRAALALALEDQGLTVETAADGRAALSRLSQGPLPDLILLDLMMPGMDGWQFLQELRREPTLSQIPIVVVSCLDANVARAAALGVADYVCKPVGVDELAARIQTYFPKP